MHRKQLLIQHLQNTEFDYISELKRMSYKEITMGSEKDLLDKILPFVKNINEISTPADLDPGFLSEPYSGQIDIEFNRVIKGILLDINVPITGNTKYFEFDTTNSGLRKEIVLKKYGISGNQAVFSFADPGQGKNVIETARNLYKSFKIEFDQEANYVNYDIRKYKENREASLTVAVANRYAEAIRQKEIADELDN